MDLICVIDKPLNSIRDLQFAPCRWMNVFYGLKDRGIKTIHAYQREIAGRNCRFFDESPHAHAVWFWRPACGFDLSDTKLLRMGHLSQQYAAMVGTIGSSKTADKGQ